MEYALTSSPIASVYRRPGFKTEMVTQSLLGEPLHVLQTQGRWNLVTLPDGYRGWMYDFYFIKVRKKEFRRWAEPDAIISAPFARAKSTSSQNTLFQIPCGGRVMIKSVENNQVQVLLPDGEIATMEKKFLLSSPFSLKPEKIIKTAYLFLGCPYLRGGKSFGGIDCSGFIQLIFGQNGIRLPRDSHPQYKSEITLPTQTNPLDLAPGHLYFFRDKSIKVTHVALSLGKGRFIHASGYVKTNSLNPEHEEYSPHHASGFFACKMLPYSKLST
jgi:cell wall-associated NlpC family hydrolase